MKDTAKQQVAQAPAAIPSFQQVVSLALSKAEHDLRSLVDIRCNDELWDEKLDVHVDFSVVLALSHLERLKGVVFKSSDDFTYEWFKIAGALNLGAQTFSRRDCAYYRMLSRSCRMFDEAAGLAEFAEMVA